MERRDYSPGCPIGSLLRYVQEGIISDPLGSYTGVTMDEIEQPVQDADDL